MSEKPIIFSAPMVRAILAGRKTQTRRLVKPQPEWRGGGWFWRSPRYDNGMGADYFHTTKVGGIMGAWVKAMPYAPGDRLWVRETWTDAASEDGPVVLYRADHDRRYLVDESYPVDYDRFPIRGRGAWTRWAPDVEGELPGCGGYRSPIHMPRWASRITLEVIGVRVQRLQEISRADAIAEGIAPAANSMTIDCDTPDPRHGFSRLWDSIHGSGSWEANPWVCAVSFRPSPTPRRVG